MSGVGAGRGGKRPNGNSRNNGGNGRHMSPTSSSPDSRSSGENLSRGYASGDNVEEVQSRMDKIQLTQDEIPPADMAAKQKHPAQPRKLGDIKVATNIYGLFADPKSSNFPMYRYDYRVLATFGNATKEFTKQSREDYVSVDRKEKCATIFEYLVQNERGFFKDKYLLVYDRAATLYSIEELAVKQGEEKEFNITLAQLPQDIVKRLGIDSKCTGITVKVKPVDEDFTIAVKDYTSSVDPNLDNQSHALQQYLELATSQAVFFNGEYVTYGTGNYLKDPAKFGCKVQDLGDGKILATGADKSVRFVEGPKGFKNVFAVIIVDTKKSAVHKPQPVLEKVCQMLKMSKPQLTQLTINDTQHKLIKHQLKDLYVETAYGNQRKFQVAGISPHSAHATRFADSSGNEVSIRQYFDTTYGIKLQFPNLPCIMERKSSRQQQADGAGQTLATYNCVPMELCHIGAHQRVTIHKQTPEQMEQMIKECAVLPIQRKQEIRTQMQAMDLADGAPNNAYLARLQLKVTKTPLPAVLAKQLPAPKALYAKGQEQIDHNKGTWRSQTRDCTEHMYYIPASCSNWWVFALCHPHDRYNIGQQLLTDFASQVCVLGKKRGMNLVRPQRIEVVDQASEGQVDFLMKEASQHGVQFVFVVQNDKLKLHKLLKLSELKYGVITQDLTMSTCRQVVERKKWQTLENIVHKTNRKLGGLNHNLLLESPVACKWIENARRLVVGLDISQPPPMSAFEKAKGMKSRFPSVIGYAANTNREPLDFVGCYELQEIGNDNLAVALAKLVADLVLRFKASRGQEPLHVVFYRGGVSEGQYKTVLQLEAPYLRKALVDAVGKCPKLTIIAATKRHNVRIMRDVINPNDKGPDQNVPCGTVVDQFIVHPNYTEFYLNSHRAPQGTAKTPRYTVIVDDASMSYDELEGLTYALCYDHQIVTMAISLPAPLKLADAWASRGRNNFSAQVSDDASSDSGFTTVSQQDRFAAINENLVYAPHLRNKCINA